MEARPLQFIASACEGELLSGSPDARVSRVCTDSRQVQVGDLFIALAGEKFDAHDFLVEVARNGAAALLVARSKVGQASYVFSGARAVLRPQHAPTAGTSPGVRAHRLADALRPGTGRAPLNTYQASSLSHSVGIVTVDDTRLALGKLAARYRSDFDLPIVAVGGSNGKTTTKELLAAVLRQKFNTLWSEASFNNDVGVPLTLLKLERGHGAAVIEVGTNHPGELPPLLQMVRPQFGVLTNIGREHLEFFGDLAGVAQEEGSLAEFLPASGKLFLNGDGDWTESIVRRTKAGVVKVGFGRHNDWRAEHVRVGEDEVRFEVESPQSEFTGAYRLRVLGRHQVPNALLALAAGRELGVTPEQARRGLAECAPPKMRLQIWETLGVRVLDDSYNANADSMLAALQTLHDLPCAGRRLAVLGDMAELGPHTAEAHREIGRSAAELGVNCLVAVGKFAYETAQAAQAAGLKEVSEFPDVPSAAATVKDLVKPGDLVLLKASRSTGLERIGEALRAGV